MLAVRDYGKGRSVIWSTDIGPHWLSLDFFGWRLYGKLVANMVTWLCQKDGSV